MTQTQQNVNYLDPAVARHAWMEADHAVKLADLRLKRAKASVDAAKERIKGASANGNLTGSAASTMADLGQRLARAMRAEEAADGTLRQAKAELKVAWKAYEPHAQSESQDEVAVPKVSHLLEQTRRAGRPPAGRSDPTIGDGPRTPNEQAAAVLEKPLAGLKAMQKAAAENGIAPSRTVPADRTDFGKPPSGEAKGSRQMRADAKAAKKAGKASRKG